MRFSTTLKRILELMCPSKPPEIIVPYGRHSYGPQPKIIGIMPFVLRKARGSRVGNFCSISPGLKFTFLGKHNYNWVSTYPFYDLYQTWKIDTALYHQGVIAINEIPPNPIIIENDVWIASNVTVKEGVRIGNGAVVAMETVVTKDVPSYAIVGGNPAKLIRYRFTKDQIDECLKIAWWNWEDKDIRKITPLLVSEDIDAFIKTAKNIMKQQDHRNISNI